MMDFALILSELRLYLRSKAARELAEGLALLEKIPDVSCLCLEAEEIRKKIKSLNGEI